MPSWLVITLVALGAIGLFALVWWSSGRSPLRGRAPGSALTPEQLEQVNTARLQHDVRQIFPNGPGGR